MEIGEALYSYLSSHSGLSSLVSTRIYPLALPQGTVLPAITYQRVTSERYHALQQDSSLTNHTFQFSIFGTKYSDVESVSEQLRSALQNYSGTMGGVAGINVQAVLIGNEIDGYDDKTKEHYKYIDYEIYFDE